MSDAKDSRFIMRGGTTRKRHKKGGNPDWIWGCYSGGKRHTTRGHNKRKRKI
jgi:hypothetical protein